MDARYLHPLIQNTKWFHMEYAASPFKSGYVVSFSEGERRDAGIFKDPEGAGQEVESSNW